MLEADASTDHLFRFRLIVCHAKSGLNRDSCELSVACFFGPVSLQSMRLTANRSGTPAIVTAFVSVAYCSFSYCSGVLSAFSVTFQQPFVGPLAPTPAVIVTQSLA
jgi:hypothetical protein